MMRHPASLVPLAVHDPWLMDLVERPVTPEFVAYLAAEVPRIVECEAVAHPKPRSRQSASVFSSTLVAGHVPAPDHEPGSAFEEDGDGHVASLPSLEQFIANIVERSNIQLPTLLCTMVYLYRLKSYLPAVSERLYCTHHRIFLAAVIVAAKNLNDSSLKNKHWMRYSGLFSQTDVNLMERQLLVLLNYDLRIDEAELLMCCQPLLATPDTMKLSIPPDMMRKTPEILAEQERYARCAARRARQAPLSPTTPPSLRSTKPSKAGLSPSWTDPSPALENGDSTPKSSESSPPSASGTIAPTSSLISKSRCHSYTSLKAAETNLLSLGQHHHATSSVVSARRPCISPQSSHSYWDPSGHTEATPLSSCTVNSSSAAWRQRSSPLSGMFRWPCSSTWTTMPTLATSQPTSSGLLSSHSFDGHTSLPTACTCSSTYSPRETSSGGKPFPLRSHVHSRSTAKRPDSPLRQNTKIPFITPNTTTRKSFKKLSFPALPKKQQDHGLSTPVGSQASRDSSTSHEASRTTCGASCSARCRSTLPLRSFCKAPNRTESGSQASMVCQPASPIVPSGSETSASAATPSRTEPLQDAPQSGRARSLSILRLFGLNACAAGESNDTEKRGMFVSLSELDNSGTAPCGLTPPLQSTLPSSNSLQTPTQAQDLSDTEEEEEVLTPSYQLDAPPFVSADSTCSNLETTSVNYAHLPQRDSRRISMPRPEKNDGTPCCSRTSLCAPKTSTADHEAAEHLVCHKGSDAGGRVHSSVSPFWRNSSFTKLVPSRTPASKTALIFDQAQTKAKVLTSTPTSSAPKPSQEADDSPLEKAACLPEGGGSTPPANVQQEQGSESVQGKVGPVKGKASKGNLWTVASRRLKKAVGAIKN